MKNLNYNHLYYFWVIANEGNLGRAAKQLLVSQSALSTQLKKLEYQLETNLFDREARSLRLTETGRLTLEYANTIFSLGNELTSVLRHNKKNKPSFKVGIVSTLSRNFVENFIRPLLNNDDLELQIDSGNQLELMNKLAKYQLDVVLSNHRPVNSPDHSYKVQVIAKQQVSIIGKPLAANKKFDLKKDLAKTPMLVPGQGNEMRLMFDAFCKTHGLNYDIMAEINDMPALRLLVRDSNYIALMPKVVVQDEIMNHTLEEYCKITGLYEHFYAIHMERHIDSDIFNTLHSRDNDEVLNNYPLS
ncbi:LysR Transcriptional regulator [Methylophilaceae bacterium]